MQHKVVINCFIVVKLVIALATIPSASITKMGMSWHIATCFTKDLINITQTILA